MSGNKSMNRWPKPAAAELDAYGHEDYITIAGKRQSDMRCPTVDGLVSVRVGSFRG
jgi:hypothetical protein